MLGFPSCILISLVVLIWGRKQLAHKPILAFFFIAFPRRLPVSCRLEAVLGWLPTILRCGVDRPR